MTINRLSLYNSSWHLLFTFTRFHIRLKYIIEKISQAVTYCDKFRLFSHLYYALFWCRKNFVELDTWKLFENFSSLMILMCSFSFEVTLKLSIKIVFEKFMFRRLFKLIWARIWGAYTWGRRVELVLTSF